MEVASIPSPTVTQGTRRKSVVAGGNGIASGSDRNPFPDGGAKIWTKYAGDPRVGIIAGMGILSSSQSVRSDTSNSASVPPSGRFPPCALSGGAVDTGPLLSGQQIEQGTTGVSGGGPCPGLNPKWRSRWLIDDCHLTFRLCLLSSGPHHDQTTPIYSLTLFL